MICSAMVESLSAASLAGIAFAGEAFAGDFGRRCVGSGVWWQRLPRWREWMVTSLTGFVKNDRSDPVGCIMTALDGSRGQVMAVTSTPKLNPPILKRAKQWATVRVRWRQAGWRRRRASRAFCLVVLYEGLFEEMISAAEDFADLPWMIFFWISGGLRGSRPSPAFSVSAATIAAGMSARSTARRRVGACQRWHVRRLHQ